MCPSCSSVSIAAGKDRAHETKGTGLGLSIVKRARRSARRIPSNSLSTPGVETSFVMRIPTEGLGEEDGKLVVISDDHHLMTHGFMRSPLVGKSYRFVIGPNMIGESMAILALIDGGFPCNGWPGLSSQSRRHVQLLLLVTSFDCQIPKRSLKTSSSISAGFCPSSPSPSTPLGRKSSSVNSCRTVRDAITARRLIEPDFAGAMSLDVVTGGDGGVTVIVEDNGIGLTQEESRRALATIAFSMKKAEGSSSDDSPFVGRFGIGILSGFLVADEITIFSRRAGSEAEPVHWVGNIGGTFTTRPATNMKEPGTRVFLRLQCGRCA